MKNDVNKGAGREDVTLWYLSLKSGKASAELLKAILPPLLMPQKVDIHQTDHLG